MVDRFLNWTIYGNLAWFELYWCIVAIVGIVVGSTNVLAARRERVRMKRMKMNGIGEAVNTTSIKGDTMRVIELAACLIIGVFGAFAPPSPLAPISTFYWWYRLTIVLAFLVIEHGILATTVMIGHNRVKVLKMWDAMHQAGHDTD